MDEQVAVVRAIPGRTGFVGWVDVHRFGDGHVIRGVEAHIAVPRLPMDSSASRERRAAARNVSCSGNRSCPVSNTNLFVLKQARDDLSGSGAGCEVRRAAHPLPALRMGEDADKFRTLGSSAKLR